MFFFFIVIPCESEKNWLKPIRQTVLAVSLTMFEGENNLIVIKIILRRVQ